MSHEIIINTSRESFIVISKALDYLKYPYNATILLIVNKNHMVQGIYFIDCHREIRVWELRSLDDIDGINNRMYCPLCKRYHYPPVLVVIYNADRDTYNINPYPWPIDKNKIYEALRAFGVMV